MNNPTSNNALELPKSVLLDTNFLISLVNSGDPLHKIASEYMSWLVDDLSVDLYITSIVLAEFSDVQKSLKILKHIRILAFDDMDAFKIHEIFSKKVVSQESGNEKDCIKDDLKILASAINNEIPHMISADKKFLKIAESAGVAVIDSKIPLSTYLGTLPSIN